MARKLRPTPADCAAVVAVADLAALWCGESGIAVAVSVLRGFTTGGRTRADLDGAIREVAASFGPYGYIPADRRSDATANAIKEARDAAIVAYNLCVLTPVVQRVWAKHERVLFGHVENVGRLVGLADAVDVTRSTWEGASTGALAVRGTMPVPHSADHARLILRGQFVTRMRARRKLTPEMLVTAVRDAGGDLTVPQLTRIENGTAAPATARGEQLARSLGCEPAWADDVETQAWAFAEKLAGLSVRVGGAGWFADVVARDGEDVARSITLIALVATLRNS